MKISAIVITHNRIEFLKDAITSIQNQTYPVHEIVIVDDGSMDPIKPRLSPIIHQYTSISVIFVRIDDLGPSAARNAGAAQATGDILCFLDDDDLWEKEYLEAASKYFLTGYDCTLTWIDNFTKYSRIKGKYIQSDFKNSDLYIGNPGITGSNIIILKHSFDKLHGFDESLLASEDKDFLIRMIKNGLKIQIIDQPLVLRRVDGINQLSINVNVFMIRGKQRFFNKYKGEMPWRTYYYLNGQLGFLNFIATKNLWHKIFSFFQMVQYPVFYKKLFQYYFFK